jgi:hypothetical protein
VYSLCVVVADILTKQPTQVLLIEDDHVIEKLAPAGPDPPFGDGVLPGLRYAERKGSIPKLLIAAVTSVEKIESRSRRR